NILFASIGGTHRESLFRVRGIPKHQLRVVLRSIVVHASFFGGSTPLGGVFRPYAFGDGDSDHFGDVGIAALEGFSDASADFDELGALQALASAHPMTSERDLW